MPALTQTATIDGYSQTGATANNATAMTNAVLKIELDGATAGATSNGLSVSAATATVRGLAINRFTGNGINLSGGNQMVAGNFIGTDVSGTLDLGNSGHGIASSGFSGSIGGSTPADVNLISGNDGDGIAFSSSNSDLVLGNFIGTAANGTSALGNTGNGISFTGGGSVFNTVGGTQSADRNVIAFNGGDGVQLSGPQAYPTASAETPSSRTAPPLRISGLTWVPTASLLMMLKTPMADRMGCKTSRFLAPPW